MRRSEHGDEYPLPLCAAVISGGHSAYYGLWKHFERIQYISDRPRGGQYRDLDGLGYDWSGLS